MLLIAAGALALGGVCGYLVFRYVLKGKYKEMVDAAEKEAEVIKAIDEHWEELNNLIDDVFAGKKIQIKRIK